MSDIRHIHRALKEQGWTVTQNGNGHWKAAAPSPGGIVHFADSSDPRAFHNAIRDLRHEGFQWPWPPLKRKSNGGQPAPDPEACSPKESDVKVLLEEMCDARDYYYLAVEHVRETEQALAAAKKSYEQAVTELEAATRTMRKSKKAFDEVFHLPEAAVGPETTQ